MSDNIPFEIQIEIIKKLPAKSLIRFRSVSTSWKSLTDSSEFIAKYNILHAQQAHMLISYEEDLKDRKISNVVIMDDDTFPQHKVSLNAPQSINLRRSRVVGSSRGLLCFFGNNPNMLDIRSKYAAVVWNVSIRKSVTIDVPGDEYQGKPAVGFGVCPNNSDPMIVKIYCNRLYLNDLQMKTCSHWKVEVFNLNSRVWKTLSSNLPSNSVRSLYDYSTVAIDRFIYWFATEGNHLEGGECYLIISFDMISEEFTQVCLPDKISSPSPYYSGMHIFRLRESLAMVHSTTHDNKHVDDVWMMENGVSKSFTKLFTINIPSSDILGFWMNDILIMVKSDCYNNEGDVVAYNPCSKTCKDLGIHGRRYSFIISSYTESLVLLNHPNTITGDDHDGHVARSGD